MKLAGYRRTMGTSDEERLAQIRAQQHSNMELCSELIGMTAAATEFVKQRGYSIRSVVIGSDAVLTAEMRTDRVNFFLSTDHVVVRAEVG
jgi:hypothetical protein